MYKCGYQNRLWKPGKNGPRPVSYTHLDEGSAALIQGITLSGVFLDEAALMPRSFIEQALARCSVEGSRFWFNCNPENPQHWFYQEWIRKADEKNALYLHFTMEDNPSLSREMRQRYQSIYSCLLYTSCSSEDPPFQCGEICGDFLPGEFCVYECGDRGFFRGGSALQL